MVSPTSPVMTPTSTGHRGLPAINRFEAVLSAGSNEADSSDLMSDATVRRRRPGARTSQGPFLKNAVHSQGGRRLLCLGLLCRLRFPCVWLGGEPGDYGFERCGVFSSFMLPLLHVGRIENPSHESCGRGDATTIFFCSQSRPLLCCDSFRQRRRDQVDPGLAFRDRTKGEDSAIG